MREKGVEFEEGDKLWRVRARWEEKLNVKDTGKESEDETEGV